jgi:hypothetical protein
MISPLTFTIPRRAACWHSERGSFPGTGWVWLMWLLVGFARADVAAATDLLATLRPEHPRLWATSNDWATLRQRAPADATLARLIGCIDADARTLLDQPPLTYKKEGRRLLAVSRAALNRISQLAFSYQFSGDRQFARRAETEMRALAAFPDWNPSHFLDTAEMTAALAIGYDWLYSELSPATRDVIRRAIVEQGLRPAFGPGAKYTSWRRAQHNWNQVCFGGLTLGALAVADEERDLAQLVLAAARQDIANGLRPYAPAGVYPEGPGYWNYGTTYQVMMLAALETALGDSWGLAASPGFLPSAAGQLHQTGPSGLVFNFSDGGERAGLRPAFFWFARQLGQPELLAFQAHPLAELLAASDRGSRREGFLPLIALWWTGLPEARAAQVLPLAWFGDGPNPIGTFRSSWTDSNAMYLAFKGGSASLNHGHMDAGTFVLEADGVRWACDLGAQDYHSIESKGWNLWNREPGGQRWKIYRLNNFSHNTLTIDGQLHQVNGDSRITSFDAERRAATVDLTAIFAGQATRVSREFALRRDQSAVIRDQLSGLKPGSSVRWQFLTHAEIHVDQSRAVLEQAGKSLRVTLSPPSARWRHFPAAPPDDGVNAPNPNTHVLAADFTAPANGELLIEVVFQSGTKPTR